MAISLSPEMLARLIAQYGNGSTAGQPAEFYDEATNTAYQPQYGGFFTPDGKFVGGFAPSNGNENAVQPLSGFQAYNRIPGSNDNFDLTGKPAQVFDTQGKALYDTTMGGFHKNGPMDYLLPALMMAAPFALTAMGAGAAGAGAGAAGGAGTSIEALQAAEALANAGGAGGGSLASGAGLGGGYGGSLTGGMGTFSVPGSGFGGSLGTLVPELGSGSALTFGSGSLGMDAALANLGAAAGGGAIGAGAGAAGAGGAGGAGAAGGAASLIPGVSNSALGAAATGLGGLLGSQGEKESQTSTQSLDPRLDAAVYGSGGLVPASQSLLQSQLPQGQEVGGQMTAAGSGLLSRPVAGSGIGQVKLNTPTTGQNPYLSGLADDISRRTQDMLGQGFNAIRGHQVANGTMGSSRQGIAEAEAMKGAADSLQGQLAGLYGSAWNNDANRSLQQYGIDTNFFGNQRAQDLQQQTLGAGLLAQGQQAPWNPLSNAAGILSNFKTGSTTNASQQGGGWGGGVGGLLGGAQFANSMGWWK